ncbi:MAG: DUF3800 domain-containing protein [Mesorhizobium sp.]|nr:DUF3800 domain-containing protein [Mesorhizobium sp.]TIR50661.1 MAG: DUF3800 domain-containing protein [Mesorhizobium sp.]
MSEIHLYIDDSGSREPDKEPQQKRRDEMDYFALGGILINEEDIDELFTRHKEFCATHGITYPLHSWAIRGGRENFGWLKKPEAAHAFLGDLEKMLTSLPVLGIAAVIDRPGYVARYRDKYQDQLWFMCKTAYCILIERAAKYARSQSRQLRIFYERAGKAEDRDLIAYTRALKKEGMPFDGGNSAGYQSLTAEQFRETVRGEPRGRTKATPMMQIADLFLYPMAKGGYDPSYRPYRVLMESKRLIDAHLPAEAVATLGIKYSCFDRIKDKGPVEPSL